MKRVLFYSRFAWFQFREPFSDLAAGLFGFLLFPYFVWLLGMIWERFNSSQSAFQRADVWVYVAITEILFLTFLRGAQVSRASSDFSISLARPRSWLGMSAVGLYSRCLGSRCIYACIALVMLPFFGIPLPTVVESLLRLLVLLPWLGLGQVLINLLFASAEVRWQETRYFILPISKIFLALGGVFAPLSDYGEPWRSLLIHSPVADFFFQPAYFCIRGEFFESTPEVWFVRTAGFYGVLMALNVLLFRNARRMHQSYGG